MALPPITVQLSKFEQLEILRAECDKREEELREIEAKLRDILYDVEKRRYLQSIHALFQECEPHPEMTNYQAWCQRRDAVHDALNNLKATLAALESETGTAPRPGGLRQLQAGGAGGAGGAGAAAGAPRRRFDTFDDFRASKGGG